MKVANTIKRSIKRLGFCLFALFLSYNLYAQETYTNPILGGDYPDPTIMREEALSAFKAWEDKEDKTPY